MIAVVGLGTEMPPSPKAVVEAFLRLVSRGKVEQACALLDQPLQAALEEQGGCQETLSPQSVTEEAKQLGRA